jgi:hypothetical protein
MASKRLYQRRALWQYRKAKAKGECPNAKAAVLIDGKGAGSIFYLCQTEKCDVHNRVTRYQPTRQEQAQRKPGFRVCTCKTLTRTEALAERVGKLSRVRILEAIRKKLPDSMSRPDLEMVALCLDTINFHDLVNDCGLFVITALPELVRQHHGQRRVREHVVCCEVAPYYGSDA